jgi:hypothetical protein
MASSSTITEVRKNCGDYSVQAMLARRTTASLLLAAGTVMLMILMSPCDVGAILCQPIQSRILPLQRQNSTCGNAPGEISAYVWG